MIFDEENVRDLEARWHFNFVKQKIQLGWEIKEICLPKCVAIFPNTESSDNKCGLIGTVNTKNWLYSDLFRNKLRHIFMA